MTETSVISRVFKLEVALSLHTGLPFCDEETFDRVCGLAKFMTGLPCPVDGEPSRYNPAELATYKAWLATVDRHTCRPLVAAIQKACHDWRKLTTLDDLPDGLTAEQQAVLLRRNMDKVGFVLERSILIYPPDEATRKAIELEQALAEAGKPGVQILVLRPPTGDP